MNFPGIMVDALALIAVAISVGGKRGGGGPHGREASGLSLPPVWLL